MLSFKKILFDNENIIDNVYEYALRFATVN